MMGQKTLRDGRHLRKWAAWLVGQFYLSLYSSAGHGVVMTAVAFVCALQTILVCFNCWSHAVCVNCLEQETTAAWWPHSTWRGACSTTSSRCTSRLALSSLCPGCPSGWRPAPCQAASLWEFSRFSPWQRRVPLSTPHFPGIGLRSFFLTSFFLIQLFFFWHVGILITWASLHGFTEGAAGNVRSKTFPDKCF